MSLTPESILALFVSDFDGNLMFPSLSFLWHPCHCSHKLTLTYCLPKPSVSVPLSGRRGVSRLRMQSYNKKSRCASPVAKKINIYENIADNPLIFNWIKICIIMLIYVNHIFCNYAIRHKKILHDQKNFIEDHQKKQDYRRRHGVASLPPSINLPRRKP